MTLPIIKANCVSGVNLTKSINGSSLHNRSAMSSNEQLSPETQPQGSAQAPPEAQPQGNEQLSPETQPQGSGQRESVSSWVFLIQLLFWLIFVGVTTWVLTRNPGVPSIHDEQYPVIIASGLALVAITPVATLLAWVLSRKSSSESRRSSFFLSLLKSATITAVGTAIWFAALLLIDIWKLSLA